MLARCKRNARKHFLINNAEKVPGFPAGLVHFMEQDIEF